LYEALKVSRRKKNGVKKTSRRRKSSQTSSMMAPERVFAIALGASKGMMQADESTVARVTRSKAAVNMINNEENLLNNNETASQQINDTLHTMGEESTVCVELSPVLPT
jgi:predicted GTPase